MVAFYSLPHVCEFLPVASLSLEFSNSLELYLDLQIGSMAFGGLEELYLDLQIGSMAFGGLERKCSLIWLDVI
jgi:hypothetical protein